MSELEPINQEAVLVYLKVIYEYHGIIWPDIKRSDSGYGVYCPYPQPFL